MYPCCVSHTSLFWRHVSEIDITSQSTRCSSLISSSSRSLEPSDIVFLQDDECSLFLRLFASILRRGYAAAAFAFSFCSPGVDVIAFLLLTLFRHPVSLCLQCLLLHFLSLLSCIILTLVKYSFLLSFLLKAI